MEARARKVQLAVIRRDLRPGPLEMLAVADGAVADARAPGRLERRGGKGDDLTVLPREDLAPLRVDDRNCLRRPGRECVESRDAGHGKVERERQPARGREAEPDTREAAGPDPD